MAEQSQQSKQHAARLRNSARGWSLSVFSNVHNPAHLALGFYGSTDAGRSYYTEFNKNGAPWQCVRCAIDAPPPPPLAAAAAAARRPACTA
jgi:hypothetical protein